MNNLIYHSLFSWMPSPLPLLCEAVFTFFIIVTLCHLYMFILDLIPFVR